MDLRPRVERRVRKTWRTGGGALSRLAGALFGAAVAVRHAAHDAGVIRRTRPGVPVLSVGALTVGGSGKTPVAVRAARWAAAAGGSPAVVTPGFADEMAVHRRHNPEVPVFGDRARIRGVRRARRGGAGLVVLDDGFQHRRVHRDLDWVVVDEELLRAGGPRLLPAGRARDLWASLLRADAVILTRRLARPTDGGAGRGPRPSPADRVRRAYPGAAVGRCRFLPGGLVPANAAAEEAAEAEPAVAFASIMKGEDFLQALRRRRPGVEHEYLFSDHQRVTEARLDEMVRLAGEGGLVGTRKDVVKVRGRVGDRTPLWCATERVEWTSGAGRLRRQIAGLGGTR